MGRTNMTESVLFFPSFSCCLFKHLPASSGLGLLVQFIQNAITPSPPASCSVGPDGLKVWSVPTQAAGKKSGDKSLTEHEFCSIANYAKCKKYSEMGRDKSFTGKHTIMLVK
jgi:hypothetical protein